MQRLRRAVLTLSTTAVILAAYAAPALAGVIVSD